jgi:hypothetical protein
MARKKIPAAFKKYQFVKGGGRKGSTPKKKGK